jgi:hypothetical protein
MDRQAVQREDFLFSLDSVSADKSTNQKTNYLDSVRQQFSFLLVYIYPADERYYIASQCS